MLRKLKHTPAKRECAILVAKGVPARCSSAQTCEEDETLELQPGERRKEGGQPGVQSYTVSGREALFLLTL